MKQQVNLYQPIFRKQRKVFSAVAMFQVAALVLAGLLLIHGWGQWQGRMLSAEVQNLEQRLEQSQARFTRLREQHPEREPSRTLERQRDALQLRLEQRRRVAEFLGEEELGMSAGFSGHLEGLARHRQDGMWLTGLRVYEGGRQMDLTGVALAEQLVPRYVQKLSDEAVFAGTEFRRVQLERSEDIPQQVLFELRGRVPRDDRGRR